MWRRLVALGLLGALAIWYSWGGSTEVSERHVSPAWEIWATGDTLRSDALNGRAWLYPQYQDTAGNGHRCWMDSDSAWHGNEVPEGCYQLYYYNDAVTIKVIDSLWVSAPALATGRFHEGWTYTIANASLDSVWASFDEITVVDALRAADFIAHEIRASKDHIVVLDPLHMSEAKTESLVASGDHILVVTGGDFKIADDLHVGGVEWSDGAGHIKAGAIATWPVLPDLAEGWVIIGNDGQVPTAQTMTGHGTVDKDFKLTINVDAMSATELKDDNTPADGDYFTYKTLGTTGHWLSRLEGHLVIADTAHLGYTHYPKDTSFWHEWKSAADSGDVVTWGWMGCACFHGVSGIPFAISSYCSTDKKVEFCNPWDGTSAGGDSAMWYLVIDNPYLD